MSVDLAKPAPVATIDLAPRENDWPCVACRGIGWTLAAMFAGDATCEACSGNGRIDGLVAVFPGVMTPDPIVRVVLFGKLVRLCAPAHHARLLDLLDSVDTYGVRRAGALGVLVMLAGPRDTPQSARDALEADWAPFVAAGIIPGR